MANIIEKFKANWKKKRVFGKITDIVFYVLIISILIPQSRIEVMGFVNGIRAMVVKPSVKDSKEAVMLTKEDLNWSLFDINGKQVNLSDSDGKIIFINNWATWCPPCVGEMPGIQKLYDKYKDNDKVAFYIITNESVYKVKDFLNERDFSFPVYISSGVYPEPFSSRSIPITFLVTPDKRILIKQTGATDWGGKKMEKIINDLLKKM